MKKLPAAALLCSLLIGVTPVQAQAPPPGGPGEPPDAELYRTIAALDTAVFDAFNRCELDKLGAYFSEDLEFYHDHDGLSRGGQAFLGAVKDNVCGKMSRDLVKGTLEVYPLKGFGALEIGVHRFHHPGRETTEPVGEGRFVHIWQHKDGVWPIMRVMSFDHRAASK